MALGENWLNSVIKMKKKKNKKKQICKNFHQNPPNLAVELFDKVKQLNRKNANEN